MIVKNYLQHFAQTKAAKPLFADFLDSKLLGVGSRVAIAVRCDSLQCTVWPPSGVKTSGSHWTMAWQWFFLLEVFSCKNGHTRRDSKACVMEMQVKHTRMQARTVPPGDRTNEIPSMFADRQQACPSMVPQTYEKAVLHDSESVWSLSNSQLCTLTCFLSSSADKGRVKAINCQRQRHRSPLCCTNMSKGHEISTFVTPSDFLLQIISSFKFSRGISRLGLFCWASRAACLCHQSSSSSSLSSKAVVPPTGTVIMIPPPSFLMTSSNHAFTQLKYRSRRW